MDFSVKSPFVLFANEFFDAVPIHIYKKSTTRWLEVLVDVDENDNFILTQSPNVTASLSLIPNVFHGSNHLELSYESGIMMMEIAKKLNEQQGSITFLFNTNGDMGKLFTKNIIF